MTPATVIAAAIGALVSSIAMMLLFLRLRNLPQASASGRPKAKISIIIPARDEAGNLAQLLPSLNAQDFPAHEIIVVDDQSTDGTGEIARKNGCKVISGQPLPEDWYGKPWACHQGAEAASGDVLLFLDADLSLERDALHRLANVAETAGRAVISVCPWHRIEKAYEELSVFFNILMLGGIGAFTWQGSRARGIGLFGQTMLIPREIYDELGGHRTVRKTILENFELSRQCGKQKIACECFSGRGTISMRMFPDGLEDLIHSWLKGFSRGAILAPPLALTLSSAWLSGLMMLTVCLFFLPLSQALLPVLGIYLSTAALQFWLFRQVGKFSFINALLFPISLMFYQAVFATALIRKNRKQKTQWKGRDVA